MWRFECGVSDSATILQRLFLVRSSRRGRPTCFEQMVKWNVSWEREYHAASPQVSALHVVLVGCRWMSLHADRAGHQQDTESSGPALWLWKQKYWRPERWCKPNGTCCTVDLISITASHYYCNDFCGVYKETNFDDVLMQGKLPWQQLSQYFISSVYAGNIIYCEHYSYDTFFWSTKNGNSTFWTVLSDLIMPGQAVIHRSR